MTHGDLLLACLLAAGSVAMLLLFLIRRTGSLDGGLRRLALIGNIGLLLIHYLPPCAAAAIAIYAFWSQRHELLIVALVVAGIGLALFRDVSFRHRGPFDFLSRTPEQDRLDRLWSETRRLWREARGDAAGPARTFTFRVRLGSRKPRR